MGRLVVQAHEGLKCLLSRRAPSRRLQPADEGIFGHVQGEEILDGQLDGGARVVENAIDFCGFAGAGVMGEENGPTLKAFERQRIERGTTRDDESARVPDADQLLHLPWRLEGFN